jgi:hypothetical protein
MHKKLAPHLIELAQDACIKSFWRRKALRSFLKQHHIAEAKLSAWHADESKRDFLQGLFYDLLSLKDNKGHAVILKIAHSLADMKHFPDLENWEDSAAKISAAKESISRLKSEVNKLDQQCQDEIDIERRKKEAAVERQKSIKARQTLESLEQQLNELARLQGTQDGGYAFEQWFYDLAIYFDIEARRPYNADGRQIDGALTLDGTTFLIETKFTKSIIESPDIDIFMSKVTSKADNTMGIFISMAGFTEGAIRTASRDRTPLLLMDYTHVYSKILPGIMTLHDVIRRIKRHASQTGEAYLPVVNFSG